MGRFDFLNGAMHTSVDTGEIVFGTMADLTSNNDGQMNDTGTFEMLLQSGQYRHKKERYLDDPMTPMVYPVFDSFNTSRKVGGLLVIDIYWRFILTNILPRNVNGVICVVENSMGQKHTYEIRGKDAVFHNDDPPAEDKDVTSQEYVLDIVANLTRSASPESRSFTAAGINGQILNYTLRVYPSHDFTNSFPEASPQVNAITVASVFAVAIALFLVYDYFVSKRQKIVLERAVKATSVVSTLFPASIREHVINDGTHETNKQGKGRDPLLGSTAQGPSSLGSTAQGPSSHPASLAMKYSDCTVCFADLVGFTQWSSIRHPEQVFKLLKTIFKEFDAAAAWRGVFKVETIGDCYMAVVRRMFDADVRIACCYLRLRDLHPPTIIFSLLLLT